ITMADVSGLVPTSASGLASRSALATIRVPAAAITTGLVTGSRLPAIRASTLAIEFVRNHSLKRPQRGEHESTTADPCRGTVTAFGWPPCGGWKKEYPGIEGTSGSLIFPRRFRATQSDDALGRPATQKNSLRPY